MIAAFIVDFSITLNVVFSLSVIIYGVVGLTGVRVPTGCSLQRA